ncbi:hypothetical protein BJV78DRAFT_565812 [Lactifluus subvellereus]|nr:hypothetical protein BJV78DRAFT_565812 [Lactifluus subvellereus]
MYLGDASRIPNPTVSFWSGNGHHRCKDAHPFSDCEIFLLVSHWAYSSSPLPVVICCTQLSFGSRASVDCHPGCQGEELTGAPTSLRSRVHLRGDPIVIAPDSSATTGPAILTLCAAYWQTREALCLGSMCQRLRILGDALRVLLIPKWEKRN